VTTLSSFCLFFVKFNNVVKPYKINRFFCYQLSQWMEAYEQPSNIDEDNVETQPDCTDMDREETSQSSDSGATRGIPYARISGSIKRGIHLSHKPRWSFVGKLSISFGNSGPSGGLRVSRLATHKAAHGQ
jgi:hypothetical protein